MSTSSGYLTRRGSRISPKCQGSHCCLHAQDVYVTDMLYMQVANGFSEEQYKVIYKRPSDLAVKSDVPVCCNVLVCDMPDEGVLCSAHAAHANEPAFSSSLDAFPCS